MRWLAPLSVAFVVVAGCEPAACREPLAGGEGELGARCVTTADCREGLACIGTDFEANALCAEPSGLPGGRDPGCLDHADSWEFHEAHGVRPISIDGEGCEVLIFESACNCAGAIGDGSCRPIYPLFRMETWRTCEGCCWRLVAYWQDDQICD